VTFPGVVIPSCPVLRIWVKEAGLMAPTSLLGRVGNSLLQTQHSPGAICGWCPMAVLTA